jgi:hypothetical protein
MDTASALSIMSSLIAIFSTVGIWPVVLVVVLIIMGPWIFSFIMSWLQDRRLGEMNREYERRFEAVREMYVTNAALVKRYDKLASEQNETISLNSAKLQEAIDGINTNQYCPMLRTRKVPVKDMVK